MIADVTTIKHAVFPLNTVLFPDGILPLQIFEQRYLNLIKSCMKNEHGFIVVLIEHGSETGETPVIYNIGTYAEIIDWESLDNGLLGITIRGISRQIINNATNRDDGLLIVESQGMDIFDEEINDLRKHKNLVDTLKEFSKHPYIVDRYPEIDYSSAATVCNRLSELLPVPNTVKQGLLETNNLQQHIEKLQLILNQLAS